MHAVIVMIVFFIKGHAVGAQLVGSTDTVADCQRGAALILQDKRGQEPKDEQGNVATPFPVCIDTHAMEKELAAPVAPTTDPDKLKDTDL